MSSVEELNFLPPCRSRFGLRTMWCKVVNYRCGMEAAVNQCYSLLIKRR
jgi:hypothetical protein